MYSKVIQLYICIYILFHILFHYGLLHDSKYINGLPWQLRQWGIHLQCRRQGLDPWVGKILWKRKWQPALVFLPGESHGQRSSWVQRVSHAWAGTTTTTLRWTFNITNDFFLMLVSRSITESVSAQADTVGQWIFWVLLDQPWQMASNLCQCLWYIQLPKALE